MTGKFCNTQAEVLSFEFSADQSKLLDTASSKLSKLGGPDASGAAATAKKIATALKEKLNTAQHETLSSFKSRRACAIRFSGMQRPHSDHVPDSLPSLEHVSADPITIHLASRNQILLALVDYRSFAFDIDNSAKQVRAVGNFKGGGVLPLPEEDTSTLAELSSHSGQALGPHTEPPYNCSIHSEDSHSPAPSALILTARWNPSFEPTRLIPARGAVEKLTGLEALALSSQSFHFTHSDCFLKNNNHSPKARSILKFNEKGGFTIRFSHYRHYFPAHACPATQHALRSLQRAFETAPPYTTTLDAGSALLINNEQALHAREVVRDNRRLLIRLFGYSPEATPIVINDDPLLVRG